MTFVVHTLMIGLQLAADGASSASFPKTYAGLPVPDAPHPPTASAEFPDKPQLRDPIGAKENFGYEALQPVRRSEQQGHEVVQAAHAELAVVLPRGAKRE